MIKKFTFMLIGGKPWSVAGHNYGLTAMINCWQYFVMK